MKDNLSISDLDLVSRLQNGDQQAFKLIYDRYWQLLYVAANKVLRNEEDAKDVVQEVFISVLAKGMSLEITGSLANYLYSAVRYKVFDFIGRQKVRDKYLDSLSNYVSGGNYSTDTALIEKEINAEMEMEIQNLPDKMKAVFELSRKEDMSHKEIAKTLNISDKTVKKQISNAIKLLKPKFTNYYLFILSVLASFLR